MLSPLIFLLSSSHFTLKQAILYIQLHTLGNSAHDPFYDWFLTHRLQQNTPYNRTMCHPGSFHHIAYKTSAPNALNPLLCPSWHPLTMLAILSHIFSHFKVPLFRILPQSVFLFSCFTRLSPCQPHSDTYLLVPSIFFPISLSPRFFSAFEILVTVVAKLTTA